VRAHVEAAVEGTQIRKGPITPLPAWGEATRRCSPSAPRRHSLMDPQDIINLCEESPRPKREAIGKCREKRRRTESVIPETVIDLSDEEEDEQLARRLWEGEQRRLARDCQADESLARRLHEEEQTARRPPAGPLGLDADLWPSGTDWLSGMFDAFPRSRMGMMPGAGPRPLPAHNRSGMSAGGRSGQLAHLSFLDRDFGEADYEMLLQLDEASEPAKKRARKANAKQLDLLPSRRLSRLDVQDEQICVICLETQRAQQVVLTLPCGHEYHKPCLLKWLKSCETPTCPTCKAPALCDSDHARDAESASRAAEAEGDSAVAAPLPPPPPPPPPPSEEWWHT